MPLLIVVNSEGKKIPLSRDEKEFLIEEIYSSIFKEYNLGVPDQSRTRPIMLANHRGSKRTDSPVSAVLVPSVKLLSYQTGIKRKVLTQKTL